MRRVILIGVGVLLLGALPAFGQRLIRESTVVPGPDGDSSWRARDLLGARVQFRDGRPVGTVSEMVLSRTGGVDYVLVRSGDDLIAVPWDAVLYDARGRTLSVLRSVPRSWLRTVTYSEERPRAVLPLRGARIVREVQTVPAPPPRVLWEPRPWDRATDYLLMRYDDRNTPGGRPADILERRFDALLAPARQVSPPSPPPPPLHSSVAGWPERTLWAR
jgi:hypothetical protein